MSGAQVGGSGGVISPFGGIPSGAAGGGLSGTYPNPSVVTDSTATDITLEGTQAAGTGLPAAGTHVHPAACWTPADSGLLAMNFDPMLSATQIMIAGTLYLLRVNAYKAFTWTNVIVVVTSAGVGTPGTGTFVGLYNSGGTLLSGSADVASSLTSGGTKTLALTTPQSIAAGTFVWVALLANLVTTQPTLSRGGSSGGAGINANLTAATFRGAVNGTGLTSLPGSITPASNSNTGMLPFWVGAT